MCEQEDKATCSMEGKIYFNRFFDSFFFTMTLNLEKPKGY